MKDYIKTILNGLLIYLKEKFDEYEIHTHSWNDLEDKPFGTKTEMVEIVPEQSVTGEEQNGVYGVVRREGFEGGTFVLSKGKKYVIVLNGKTYESEASTFNFGNNTDDIIIGDKDISDFSLDNPNMPFSISSGEMNTGGIACQIMWRTELGETITLAIYEEQETVQHMNPKFVFDPIIFTNTQQVDESGNEIFTCNKTFAECLQDIENNNINVFNKGSGVITTPYRYKWSREDGYINFYFYYAHNDIKYTISIHGDDSVEMNTN